jgi:hypothetical protein
VKKPRRHLRVQALPPGVHSNLAVMSTANHTATEEERRNATYQEPRPDATTKWSWFFDRILDPNPITILDAAIAEELCCWQFNLDEIVREAQWRGYWKFIEDEDPDQRAVRVLSRKGIIP